jgi:hypothetical protein
MQAMRGWYDSHPHLFLRTPYDRAGLNIHQDIDMNNLMELLAAPPQRQVLALFKD